MQKAGKTKATKIKYCNDVNNEFFIRFYDLLYSNFNKEDPQAIISFPPMNPGSETKAEPVQPFNSRIAELRVKRAQEKRINNLEENEKRLTKEMRNLEQESEENNEQIDEIFEKVGVQRAQVPVYIQNQQKDAELLRQRAKPKKKHEDLDKVQIEYTSRLEKSKEIGRTRAIQRYEKLTGSRHPRCRENPVERYYPDEMDQQ